MLPAAFLRAFILEHLTKENVGRYQPELLLVDASDDEMAEGKLASNAVRLLKLIKAQREGGGPKAAQPFFTAFGFHRPHV